MGLQGSISVLFSGIGVLLYKTLIMWLEVLNGKSAVVSIIGTYAKIVDNYSVELSFILDSYSLSYIVLTISIGYWAL